MPSDFAHPGHLLLLVVVLGLAAAYLTLQLRRRALERRWADDALQASSAPRRPGLLRHLAPALLLASLVPMIVGFAGPREEVEVALERAVVVLAVDNSASMLAEDVAPDRFTAAKQAATQFAQALPDGFEIALVGFAARAQVLVPPTSDVDEVTRAIAAMELSGGTALGDALQASVTAVAARDEGVPAAVVLLADGGSTVGSTVQEGVAAAVEAEIPVATIAYGTPQGVVVLGGAVYPVPVDEQVLEQIAEETSGTTYTAATAGELERVYESIRARLSTTVEEQDVSDRYAGAALLLLGAAAVPALLRTRWT